MNGNAPEPRDSQSAPAPVSPAMPLVGPVQPLEVVRPPVSEWVAAWLKLGAALCALGAVGLFVRPLLLDQVNLLPRMLTLQPTFASEPEVPEVPAGSGATPQEASPGSVTREERAEFDGAILMVDSEPSGATVLVNGQDQGETPVSVGLECTPGTPVAISISLRGYERAKHTTLCPHDALVKVTARMRKSSGKPAGKK